MVRIKCLFLILSLSVVNLMAQEVKTLSVPEMHEDIDYYYSTIKSVHPNLYARYSESEFDSLYQEIKNQCNSPLSVTEFGIILDKFNGFTDGHTKIVIEKYLPEQRFPWVHCKDDKICLNNDVLISIRGIDAKDLQRRISPTISWEFHPQRKMYEFNAKLNDILTNYYKLGSPFGCQIMDVQKGCIKDTLVYAISREKWSQNSNPSRHPTYHEAMLHQAIYEDESVAVLYYNTSDIRKIPQKYFIQAIDNFFNEVRQKNISCLFVDVSQNGGGSDLVHNHIFKYLKHEAYRSKTILYSTKEGATRLYSFLESLLTNFDMHDKNQKESYRGMKNGMKKVKKRIRKGKIEYVNKTKRNIKGFEGEVFVIMGAENYSAGNSFCEITKLSKAGQLVGESSGQFSPYSTESILGTLPNSMLEFGCATTYIVSSPPIPPESGFLQPDIPYPLTKPLELEDFKEIIRISKHH